MQFSKFASLLAAAALASANTVTFQSLDSTDRTIYFTTTSGEDIPATSVPGGASIQVNFPQGWTGNWYSVSNGSPNVPGMLGEVAFNSWNDISFFDVSAIVNPGDTDGVKEIYPAGSNTPVSGCQVFPCNSAYYQPDDVQTKSTTETDLVCTLGSGSVSSRDADEVDSPSFKREFVLGRWTK